ncbi:High-affinity Fe2+/Pb2+ permease [Ignavibacterium album JCM 16511]|uniref:High-affinity Fe2+/Pb2+ permease n=1 Tax=Ignavibacterium album (strain DSM 19864 / JCM 16511 / NBRC 101810 / Mat9-16) TaxID=945713 RepID=I0AJE5_IGNAJ|nr:cytochrome c [Ignavibacterium album]AFH49102.1 High-affinity Fe2+/Pb2+ permease [Ignavibacterium album JCM 16511]
MKEFFEQIKEKIDEIKNSPGTIFGLVFPYFLIVGVLIGLYFVSKLEFLSRQKVPPVLRDTVVVADLQLREAKVVPPVKLSEIKNATPQLLSEGETLYKSNCASCHGETGAGGGPASAGLNPAPRNFTSPDGWKNGPKLSQIYTTLQEGIPGSAMVSYDYLLPEQKFALAHYIRTNFVPNPPEDTQADLDALDATYNLSAGQEIPAQIPVALAKTIIYQENKENLNRAENALSKIENSPSKKFFSQVTSNKNVALMFLVKNFNSINSEQNFKKIVINNVNQNGFNGNVFNLSDQEWSELYKLVISVL